MPLAVSIRLCMRQTGLNLAFSWDSPFAEFCVSSWNGECVSGCFAERLDGEVIVEIENVVDVKMVL